jgi:hypothetical protein
MLLWNRKVVETGVELLTRAKRAAAEPPAPRNSAVPALANHISPTAAQCLCWPRKRWKSEPSSNRRPTTVLPTSAVSNRWGPMNGAQENRDPARWAACQRVPRAPRLTNCSPPTTMTVATLPRDDDGGLVMIPPCERTVEGCWKTCQLHASGDFDMLQG